MTEQLVGQFGYVGIALLLVLGGLGLPVPEEAPIILAAVLSKNNQMWWPLALTSCFVGVLLGDFVVYFLGFFYGETVMSLRLTRKFLTRAREAQIKGYFHRHGFKILILGRFAVGFRTAAYLTAGILKLPALKLFLTDLFAASLSTGLMFGLGYVFAHQIQRKYDQFKGSLLVAAAAALAGWLLYRYYKALKRGGRPVGPPVLVSDDVPLPPDDLHAPKPPRKDTSGFEDDVPFRPDAPPTVSAPVTAPVPAPDSPSAGADPGASPDVEPPRAVPVEIDTGHPPPLKSHSH